MKNISTLIALFITSFLFSQSGINYKAVIKNGSGVVVANQLVQVQLAILEGAAQTNVFTESHTPTTDANGIVILEIGTGLFVSGSYSGVAWVTDDHFLNVQVNIGGGLVDLGTTQFMSVPYALIAEEAKNVTGLESLDEGNGIGWRLKDADPANYGAIGEGAVDLSISEFASETRGATSAYSTAMGRITTASGVNSTAMGENTTASGNYSTAMGFDTTASGSYSTAMGYGTKAESVKSTAIGTNNLGGGNPINWIGTDPLFEIGNSQFLFGAGSNALTVLKNGTITAPSLTNALINTAGDKALLTKEYADANLVATGLEALDEGNGIGHRIIGRNSSNVGNIGLNAVDLSGSPVASTTYGATGEYSVAMNRQTTAQGLFSTAMGLDSKAYGNTSTVMGFNTVANGYDSAAMGAYTVADASQSLAIGRYNIGGGNNQNWNPLEPIFEIGIGSGPSARANAVTVLKNGNVGIGNETPNKKLVVEGTAKVQSIEFADNTIQTTAAFSPIAFGSIASNASIYGGSGNFSVVYNVGSSSYQITISGESYSILNYTTVVTPFNSGRVGAITPLGGVLEVIFFDPSNPGVWGQSGFQFVVYKH